MLHKGFRPAAKREPYFELFYLPYHEAAALPQFKNTIFTETEGKFVTHEILSISRFENIIQELL